MGQWDIHEPASSEETDNIVIKMGQNMSIELFVYTLCKTTVNCRMVSKNPVAFFLLPVMSCVRWQYLNLFSFAVDPEAIYSRLPLKLHDWRPAITRGWTRVVRAFCIQESTIGPFRFTLFSNWNVCRLFLCNSTSIEPWYIILYLVLL